MKLVTSILLSLTALAIFVNTAGGHAIGQSLETKVGDMLVDVGYDTYDIVIEEPVRFDFNLYKGEEYDEVDFDHVWIRLTGENGLIFAGGIHRNSFGITGFTTLFPRIGQYSLDIRYIKDGDTVVETEFPLEVIQGDKPVTYPITFIILSGITGLIIGGAGYWVLSKTILRK